MLPGPGAYDPPSAFEQPLSKKSLSGFSAKTLKSSMHSTPAFIGLKSSSRVAGTQR